MSGIRPPKLDRVIHERARLLIMTYLASAQAKEIAFNELKNELSMSAGNLSIQMRTLERSGLITIRKEFRGAKPFTGISLTAAGRRALKDYLAEMDMLLGAIR
ncbi:MAG: transcriptional regulator [Spirochaetota bacterium]